MTQIRGMSSHKCLKEACSHLGITAKLKVKATMVMQTMCSYVHVISLFRASTVKLLLFCDAARVSLRRGHPFLACSCITGVPRYGCVKAGGLTGCDCPMQQTPTEELVPPQACMADQVLEHHPLAPGLAQLLLLHHQ